MSTRLVIRKTKYSTDELFIKAKKSPKYSPNTVKRLVTRKDGVTQSYWVGLGEHIESRMKAGMKFWQAQISVRAFDHFKDTSEKHVEPRQPIELVSIVDAKELARSAQAELNPMIEHWAKLTGGKPQPRKTLKSDDRIQMKVEMDYQKDGKPDYSRAVDIAGGRIVFTSMNKLFRGLAILLTQKDFTDRVIRFKDRFLKPVPSQYRDMLFNLKLKDGVITEFRLELEDFTKASDDGEHLIYEEKSEIRYRAFKENNRNYTPEEFARIKHLNAESKSIYAKVWKNVKMNNYKEV